MEKIITKKPPLAFTILLFLFMMLVVINIIAIPDNLKATIQYVSGIDSFSYRVVYSIVELMALVFAFMSIYRVLQRKSYGMAMLKFSSFYMLFLVVLRLLGLAKGIRSNVFFIILLLVCLFCIIFCLYLYKSKALRSYIPIHERKFGWTGWLAMSIFAMFLILWVYPIGRTYLKNYKSQPQDIKSITLNKGEVTDGYIVFKPLDGWKLESDNNEFYIYSSKKDNCFGILVATVIQDCPNRTDYYVLLSESYRAQVPNFVKMKEVFYDESEMSGNNKFYMNTYELTDSVQNKTYWTFSALVSRNSYKVATMSNFETGSYIRSNTMAKEFMKSVRFELKK